MSNISEIKALVEMLNQFISELDCSMEMAGKIELALDDLFPDDDEIQDFVTCFASYRPGGGDYLYDKNRMIKESKVLLNIINSNYLD